MRKLTMIGWAVLTLSLGSFCNLPAQELVAHIRGIVTDPSGAGVPGADVKATNTQTQVSTTVPSQEDGTYEFLSLAPGTYEVTATKSGFRTFSARNITLTLNQIYNLPVSLEVGQVTESVQVEASAVQVETTTTQMGTVIGGQQIVDLPLLNRNWVQLQQLAPGVVSASDRFTVGSYSTNGSESQQNSFLINGADSIDIDLNTPLVVPSPDAIAEFNLIDSTINPEYGRNSGGILNAIIKSGTNQYHGDAFEFYRDTFLNTHNFFQRTKPIFHQNQFGGTVGGPIWKDHTFFFLSYQGTRNRSPDSNALANTVTVFTPDQRNGFFPSIVGSTGTSATAMVGESGATYAAGTPYSVLFPTGHIPTRDFNSVATGLVNKYVPLPNLGADQFSFNPTQTQTNDQGIAKLDHTFSDHDSMWFSLFTQTAPTIHSVSFIPTAAALPGAAGELDSSAIKLYTASWNHTFNPTTLNELRLSYLRFNFQAVEPTQILQPSSLGFTGINPQFPSNAGVPLMSLTGYFALGFTQNGPQPRIDQNYQLTDNFSKVVGSHTLKVGFNGTRYEYFNPFENSNSGAFTFGGAGKYTTGDAGADFLLGLPDSYLQGSGGVVDARTYEYYLYAQDSWKVSNDLTLNYGLGYQVDTPFENHYFNNLDMNCFRPGQQSTVFPTAPLGLLFPGDASCSLSGYYPRYDHVAPRFGFAYSPNWGPVSDGGNKKLVIRGGWGIYFNRTAAELATQTIGNVPFSITSSGIGDVGGNPSFANPFTDVATGQTIPNKFPLASPTKGAAVNFSTFEPFTSEFVVNPNYTAPYAMNFNLNIQRELPGSMILQVGYVGAQGRHLELVYEGNPISPAGAAACAADPACVADRANQHIDFPSHAMYAPGNIFATVMTAGTMGVSNYNSLQTRLEKRFSHGITFLAAYTWSHSIDDTSGFEDSGFYARGINPYNFALNRGDSAFDARHRFVVNYTYELPHLSRYWNNAFTKYAADGWRFSGITTLQTGFPITVTDTGFRSLTCDFGSFTCWDAPNTVGYPGTFDPRNSVLVSTAKNPANTIARPNYYFNPNAFTLEPIGTIGSAGRNNFHGPGLNNTDLSLSKEVRFTESRSIELRLEAFNAFNHTQFRFSSNIISFSDINSSTFGRTSTAAPGRVVQLGAKIYF